MTIMTVESAMPAVMTVRKMSSQFHHHESIPQAWSPTNEDGDDAAVDMTVTTAAMPLLTAHCCDCCRIMFVVPSVLFFPS